MCGLAEDLLDYVYRTIRDFFTVILRIAVTPINILIEIKTMDGSTA
jgi:hypothetical protein